MWLKTGRRKLRSILEVAHNGGWCMLRMVFLVTALFAGATWAVAETIDVKYYGKLDLAPFACTDVTRSSFINRACYDKAQQFMVVQLVPRQHP